jgi:hypothetical protein
MFAINFVDFWISRKQLKTLRLEIGEVSENQKSLDVQSPPMAGAHA